MAVVRYFLCLIMVFAFANAWLAVDMENLRNDLFNSQTAPRRPVAQNLNILAVRDRIQAMKTYLETANLPQTVNQRKVNRALLQALIKMLGKNQITEVDRDHI
ncbi:uncharacterized protein LOC129600347 [Paramacrobiotus metropolitanus]|uniref:uncharacterized protein LOC129600347 n=1 Tax=Paramacrobiotus metropolitanus TaxID=2943436 RepID=UPI002445C7D5|nr:uncharacterized protein LOC129600347 [Paramacrobiotus metropolitanus]